MSTNEAAFIAAMLIAGTGFLTVATVMTVTAVCEWIDGAALRRSRRRFESRRARVRARYAGFSYQKNGGLHFIKLGRFGAAVWVSRR
jgi:hypothetical protein